MKTRAVVTGATGAQGAAIARAFAAAGYEVAGLTRGGGRPGPDGVRLVAVDESDDGALCVALEGADVLAFTSPIDHRQGVRERLAERLARAAEAAGVGRVVLNTAGAVPDGLDRPVATVLRAVRATVLSGAVPASVVQPTVYMDNLAAPWAVGPVAAGVLAYPAPSAARVSWVSHATLAAAVVAAAEHPDAPGRTYDIGGPEPLTGPALAERLGRVLGRAVRYEAVPLDAFAAGMNAAMGAPAGDDIADLYRHLAESPDAFARDGSALAALGVAPEPFEAWAARQSWPAPATAAAAD